MSRMRQNGSVKVALMLGLILGMTLVGILSVGEMKTQAAGQDEPRRGFMGHPEKKGCTKCHQDQYDSWKKTTHGTAMDSLKSGVKEKEKIKAKLDQKKDYTEDNDCLPCHTTGFNKGGYVKGNSRKMSAYYGVGCETCHGGGDDYMAVKQRYPKDDFPREEVIQAGMKYGEEETCRACHNDDSPFKPSVDPKYKLDYKNSLKKGTHKHFKLKKHAPRKGSESLYE